MHVGAEVYYFRKRLVSSSNEIECNQNANKLVVGNILAYLLLVVNSIIDFLAFREPRLYSFDVGFFLKFATTVAEIYC